METLKQHDFQTLDLSQNELAKVHVRHLAGGRACVPHERLIRFEFPEVSSDGCLEQQGILMYVINYRFHTHTHDIQLIYSYAQSPGALQRFLLAMDISWNVTLFHYRNHGADFGRVLVGIQVPDKCDKNFVKFLDTLGYRYTIETENPAYTSFLRNTHGGGSKST